MDLQRLAERFEAATEATRVASVACKACEGKTEVICAECEGSGCAECEGGRVNCVMCRARLSAALMSVSLRLQTYARQRGDFQQKILGLEFFDEPELNLAATEIEKAAEYLVRGLAVVRGIFLHVDGVQNTDTARHFRYSCWHLESLDGGTCSLLAAAWLDFGKSVAEDPLFWRNLPKKG